jgi:hypothetical protein
MNNDRPVVCGNRARRTLSAEQPVEQAPVWRALDAGGSGFSHGRGIVVILGALDLAKLGFIERGLLAIAVAAVRGVRLLVEGPDDRMAGY